MGLAAGCVYACLPVYLSVCLPACLPVCLSVCLSVRLSVCSHCRVFVYLLVCLPVFLAMFLSLVLLSVCLPACLLALWSAIGWLSCMSAYLPACLPHIPAYSSDNTFPTLCFIASQKLIPLCSVLMHLEKCNQCLSGNLVMHIWCWEFSMGLRRLMARRFSSLLCPALPCPALDQHSSWPDVSAACPALTCPAPPCCPPACPALSRLALPCSPPNSRLPVLCSSKIHGGWLTDEDWQLAVSVCL